MMEFHPFADKYPMMPEADLLRLEGRMKDGGFNRTFPIVRYQGKILDGRNRFKSAKSAGIDPYYVDFKGNDEEAKQFVIDANEHRRHLTEKWLTECRAERISRVIEARKIGDSTRQIAETEGVSQTQVLRDIEEANSTETSPGSVEPPNGKVTGKDGKKRDAKKPATPKVLCARCQRIGTATKGCEGCKTARAAAKEEKQAQPPPKSTEIPKDADGTPYPAPALPAVQNVSRLTQLERHLREGIELAQQIGNEPIGLYLDPSGITARLTEAKSLVLAAHPKHVCKNCAGEDKKCKWCKGQGWQTRGGYKQCPEPGK